MPKLKNVDEPALKKLAFDLGKKYLGKGVSIGLVGDLGSGKTTFTKSFAKALGIKKVKSPTFIVVAAYKVKKQDFYHADFYRLNYLDQLQALGLKDMLSNKSSIVVIEWVDKFPAVAKECNLLIKLSTNKNNTRDVQITFN